MNAVAIASVAPMNGEASIRAVDVQTHNVRTLALAAADPVGLSLEGRRLAWAENLKTSARIRALTVKP